MLCVCPLWRWSSGLPAEALSPEQVCPSRDLQHATEIRDECCRLKLWHAEAAPLVLAGREGQRWKEKW